jgi:uncharacterized membrane protein YkoI
MEEKKHGRRIKGNEKRVTRSIRIEPAIKAQIEEIFGSVQKWFDEKLEQEFGGTMYEVEVVKKGEITRKARKPKPANVTVDDF